MTFAPAGGEASPLHSVAAAAAPVCAQTRATATGSTTIIDPAAALSVTQNLAFSITPSALNFGLTITSSSARGFNALFSLSGGQTASIAVPSTIDVTRVGGTESITVHTLAPTESDASNALFTAPVTVVGTLDKGQLDFAVGGAITVANDLKPGQYEGVLTVVAQYD